MLPTKKRQKEEGQNHLEKRLMKTITVFKYLEIRGKEAKEKYSLYSMSMGEIILNKIFSRETSLMKWIIAKTEHLEGL